MFIRNNRHRCRCQYCTGCVIHSEHSHRLIRSQNNRNTVALTDNHSRLGSRARGRGSVQKSSHTRSQTSTSAHKPRTEPSCTLCNHSPRTQEQEPRRSTYSVVITSDFIPLRVVAPALLHHLSSSRTSHVTRIQHTVLGRHKHWLLTALLTPGAIRVHVNEYDFEAKLFFWKLYLHRFDPAVNFEDG